jgi:hypothetical protein
MLVVFLLVVGLVFVEGTMWYVVANPVWDANTDQLMKTFGSISRASISLLKALTGGDDWGNIYDCAVTLGFFYQVFFLVFIVYCLIALMNIVTAVFVDSMMETSKSDRDCVIQTEIKAKGVFLDNMRNIFDSVDEDGSGEVDFAELELQMTKPDIGAYFAGLGVDVDQVGRLFRLLDEDDSGSISRNEFIYGCLRLRGEAKSLDIALLSRELFRINANLEVVGLTTAAWMDSIAEAMGLRGNGGSSDSESASDDDEKKAEEKKAIPEGTPAMLFPGSTPVSAAEELA